MERPSYLLDSNILCEPSRLHPNVHVQARLLAHRHAVCTAALQGRTPPCIDGQLAAIAIVNRLTLVTRNTNDFADVGGLTMENWCEG